MNTPLYIPLLVMSVPVLMLVFAWTSVTQWLSARAAERRTRERFALLRHLSERPAESVQLVLEQLRQDDAREEERLRSKRAATRRGKLEGAFILLVIGGGLAVVFRVLSPVQPLWLIGGIPLLTGAVLGASAWLEASQARR